MLATIHFLCEANPGPATAVVNGVIAGSTVMSAGTAFGGGLTAAALAFSATKPEIRADQINRGLGVGFLIGSGLGLLMLIVFSGRVVT